MSSMTIVIPCYNEAENIPVFFPELQKFADANNFQVLAVNDGSRDATADELAKFSGDGRIKVISHKCNRGYGGAIKTGLKAVQTEFAITMDSDGQHRLEDVLKCFKEIKKINTQPEAYIGSKLRGIHYILWIPCFFRNFQKIFDLCVVKV